MTTTDIDKVLSNVSGWLVKYNNAKDFDEEIRADITKMLDTIGDLVHEKRKLQEQVNWLQASNTAHLMTTRAVRDSRTVLSGDVEAFMHLFDQPVRSTPGVPEDKTVRLAAALVMEEAFEFLEAVMDNPVPIEKCKLAILADINDEENVIFVDLPEAIDALGDLDYVSEWSRLAFGVKYGNRIAAAIQQANISKFGGPKDPITGKQQKPSGWKPPDIRGVLKDMGWEEPEIE